MRMSTKSALEVMIKMGVSHLDVHCRGMLMVSKYLVHFLQFASGNFYDLLNVFQLEEKNQKNTYEDAVHNTVMMMLMRKRTMMTTMTTITTMTK